MEAARCSVAARRRRWPAPTLLPRPGLVSRFLTPRYFVEKILTSKRALEGEHSRVPVRFADLKGSTDRQAASPWLTSPLPSWTYNRVCLEPIDAAEGRSVIFSLRACGTASDRANATLRLYILAALQTAARRSELARLRWTDVDLKRRTITFPKTKNGDRRVVPMTEALAEVIESLPRNIDSQTRVFPERDPQVITRSFARLVKRLRLIDLTFHDLRHDAASTLTMAGAPQRAIMEILGHRDPRMTLRYQHLAPDYLKQAMRSLDRPRADLGKTSLGTI